MNFIVRPRKCIMTSFHKCYVLKVNIKVKFEISTFFELKVIGSGTRFMSLAAKYIIRIPHLLRFVAVMNEKQMNVNAQLNGMCLNVFQMVK